MARKTTESSTKKRVAAKSTPNGAQERLGGGQDLITSPIVASQPPGKPPKKSQAELAAMDLSELDLAAAAYRDGHESLAAQMAYTSKVLAGDREAGERPDIQLASHLKFLMDGMTVIVRELRQIEKHQVGMASKIPPERGDELIVSYILESLPKKRRDWVLDALAARAPEARGLL